jgi:hypothetical protein
MNGIPYIDHVDITGPFKPTGLGDTPSRRRHFHVPSFLSAFNCVADETNLRKEDPLHADASSISPTVTDADLKPFMAFYQSGRKAGSFEAGIQDALQAILTSPNSCFARKSILQI